MTNLTIRATTTDAELDAIPYLDMRREAAERRNDARAVDWGDQIVLEYIEYPDGVAVLYSDAFAYAYVNQHSPGVGDSLVINAGDASSASAAADIYRRTMTSSTLYTVARSDGENREYNLTLAEAARAILHHDGCDYDILPRADGEGYELWTRQQVAGIPWRRASYFSFEETIDAAEADIFQQVVDKSGCDGWRGLVATRQEDYLAMLDRMRADYDPVDDADEIAALDAEIAEIK